MNNRLADFTSAWNDEDLSSDEETEVLPTPSDIEKQENVPPPRPQPNYMENFFREMDSIKADIDVVSETCKKIAEIHEQALSATTTEEETALSRQLKPLIDNTNKRAKRTKTLLGLLKEETDKLKAQDTLNPSDIRYVKF